jgi:hypothetical protein
MLLLIPAAAWATQGVADSCMIVTVGLLGIPAALTMVGLGIGSLVRLIRKPAPRPRAGRTALVLSLVCLGLFCARVIYCMSVAEWDIGFSSALLELSSPILVLALASAVIAGLLMRRAAVATRGREGTGREGTEDCSLKK